MNTTREEASKFMPVGVHWSWRIYKDVRNSRWQVYNPMWGTISRSWPTRGELGALQDVLRETWRAAIELADEDECPYAWLQDDAA